MKIKLTTTLCAILFAAIVAGAAGTNVTEEENKILALVLKNSYPDGGFTVVSPDTESMTDDSTDTKETARWKKEIAKSLQTNGIVVTGLVDQLFARNRQPVRLSLKSSPKDGYIIDFDGKFQKYFKKDGGGWKKWHKEHPEAQGSTRVSLPVYEHKTGMVIIYLGTQAEWLAGSGWVILYHYENGSLKEIKRVMLWIS